MTADRKFLANHTPLMSRADFVDFLRRCAADWLRVADGSFYGIHRRVPDAEAIAQSERVLAMAERIESEGRKLK